jgi:biotin carboxylase
MKKIAIVDAYSGAKHYPQIAKRLGTACVHIQSEDPIPDCYARSFTPERFVENLIFKKDISQIAQRLRELKVEDVIAGIETGVELADELTSLLGLPGNDPTLSLARRDKKLMHDVARTNGIRVPNQISVTESDPALKWIAKHQTYPVVVKPPRSAGSDGFRVCRNEAEVVEAIHELVGKTNKLGKVNDTALVQEFIQGEEFAVNAVSCEGVHKISHIWHYRKSERDGYKIYDWESLLDPTSAWAQQLKEMTYATLNAVGITNGPSHTEIMIDNRGPVLIETAGRIDGISNPGSDEITVGVSQIELAILAKINPLHFRTRIPEMYHSSKLAVNVAMISNHSGIVNGINIETLQGLRSYAGSRLFISPGEHLSFTKDIFTSPGFVFLAHDDNDVLLSDYREIRRLELDNKIFELAEARS